MNSIFWKQEIISAHEEVGFQYNYLTDRNPMLIGMALFLQG
jgi:hypothetical protein